MDKMNYNSKSVNFIHQVPDLIGMKISTSKNEVQLAHPCRPTQKYKYKYVISTAPLTPVVTSGALSTVSSHKRLRKETFSGAFQMI